MTRDEAIAYVNEPGISPVERAQRKNEVFTVLYGRKSERHPLEQLVPEAATLRFIGEAPKYHEVDFYTGAPEGYLCQGRGCAICRMQEDTAFVPWLDRWVEDNPWPILALIFLALFVIFCSIAWNMGPAGATSSAGTVACTGDGTTGQRFEVVYIGTTFEADRAVIERELTIADRAVQRSSIAAGRHLLLRWEHDDRCRANIRVIEQRSTGHWNEAVSVLASTDPGNNVLVFSSGESSEGACGRGDRADDDRPGVDNVHQLGGRWALVTRCGWSAGVIVHEIAHSLGAVQPSAPHVSSDRFHTSEAVDLLTSGWDGALTCGGTPDGRNLILDCGNDDYFDPTPEPGEYLSTHWNIADSVFFTPRLAVMNG